MQGRPHHQHLDGVNGEVFDKEVVCGEQNPAEDSEAPPQHEAAPGGRGPGVPAHVLDDDGAVAGEHHVVLVLVVEDNGVAADPGVRGCQGVPPADGGVDGARLIPSLGIIIFCVIADVA